MENNNSLDIKNYKIASSINSKNKISYLKIKKIYMKNMKIIIHLIN